MTAGAGWGALCSMLRGTAGVVREKVGNFMVGGRRVD